jgi:uncharacterized protein YggE
MTNRLARTARWKLLIGGVAAATAIGVGSVAFAGTVTCGCGPEPQAVPSTVPEVPPTPPSADSGHTITVPGTGTVQVEPDTATVNLGVQVTRPTGAEAMEQVSSDAAAITEALVAAGIAEEDIQTTNLSLYSMTGDDGSTVTGYNASLSINVTVRDIDTVGSTIDTAQQAGGDGFTIGGVAFSFADPESVLEQARIDALANARAKAEQYAAAAGVELGGVVSIVEGASYPPVIYGDLARLEAADSAAAGPPISPGQLDLTIDISVTFAIS